MPKFCMILVLGLIASGCSKSAESRFELIEEYQMSDPEWASYQAYQTGVEEILLKNWTQLTKPDADYPELGQSEIDALIAAHTPTDGEARNCDSVDRKPQGMLLIHGLYDSPYVMRDLETYFRNRCFHTHSILLPGHGTRPGSLLDIRYSAWVGAVNLAISRLSETVDDDVYITGFSNGGLLALNAALEQPRVKGIFLFAPALELSVGPLARILGYVGMDWVPFQKLKDKDLIKYESITLDSVIQVSQLAAKVQQKMHDENTRLEMPVMLVVAKNDYTINSNTAIQLYQQGRFGDQSDMLIYAPRIVDGNCVKGLVPGDPTATPKLPAYLGSCFVHQQKGKEYMIGDYSHMSLTLKSTDDHYGLEGRYKYCLQYLNSDVLAQQCKLRASTSSDTCFGERELIGSVNYPQCEKRGLIVRRLTSNPQFDELTQYLDQFISQHIDKRD